MRTSALLILQLTSLVVRGGTVDNEQKIYPVKCCGKFTMLSGDGKSCIDADWPQNVSHPFSGNTYSLSPFDMNWLRRWLPPGVSTQIIPKVYYNTENLVNSLPNIVRVNSSSVWNIAKPLNKDILKNQMIFYDPNRILRPKPGGGGRKSGKFCVDAALPPLGPFALLFGAACTQEECARKCCSHGEVLVDKDGTWVCTKHDQNYWSPFNSSFAKDIDPEFPLTVFMNCPHLHLSDLTQHSLSNALSLESQHHFSTRRSCFDYYLKNNTAKEGLFYCEYMRVRRGIYWLLQPLCIISVLLLAMSLVSIACDKSMRQKIHGWCLAHHAACLLAFNMGQVVYYVTLSNIIDDNRTQDVPRDLWKTCTHFGLCMYFLLTAAWFWLTAVCANMALGFKLRAVRSSRSGGKRFVFLSVLAWGLPAVLTLTYSFMFVPSKFDYIASNKVPWYNPQLMETRVCYTETVFVTLDEDYNQKIYSIRYGTFSFYYGPIGCLVLCNCVCLGHALKKLQNLRRGNSILRKDEREDQRQRNQDKNTRPAPNTQGRNEKTDKTRNGSGRQAAIDAKTIKIYIKLLLMTGIIEIFSESVMWLSMKYSHDTIYDSDDYNFLYRASGYVTDFFRAVCVTWLAAPEGGYMGLVRGLISGEKENRKYHK